MQLLFWTSAYLNLRYAKEILKSTLVYIERKDMVRISRKYNRIRGRNRVWKLNASRIWHVVRSQPWPHIYVYSTNLWMFNAFSWSEPHKQRQLISLTLLIYTISIVSAPILHGMIRARIGILSIWYSKRASLNLRPYFYLSQHKDNTTASSLMVHFSDWRR